MSINIYDQRNMIAALHQDFMPRTFLSKTFFNFDNPVQHDTENIDIDIKKSKRRVAEWQSHRLPGKLVEKENYKTISYKPGYLKPKKVITIDDILTKPFGSANIYGPHESPASRAQQELGKELAELQNIITRRVEVMSADVLEDGVVTISGDGIEDYLIDFQMAADHKVILTGTDRWDQTGSLPITKMRTWKRLISKDSGIAPSICVLGSDAWDAFLANAEVLSLLDKLKINIGQVQPMDRGDGATYQATIEGIEYWTYDEWYYDRGTSANKVMVPANKIFLGTDKAYTAVHFGMVKDLDVTAQVNYYPKTWTENDPSARFLMVQSAPMVGMHQSDAFLTAQVID